MSINKKFSSSIVISLFCLIVIVSTQGTKQKQNSDDIFTNSTESCESIFNETAALVEPVLLIGSKKFPLTIAEIDEHCKLGTDVYKRVRKYGKCLQGLARQTLLIYLHGLKRFIRSICNSTKKKQEAIDDLRCADSRTLKGWNNCMNTVNRQLNFVGFNSTSVGVVGDVCCIYSTVIGCLERSTGTIPGCSPKADTTRFFKHSLSLVLKEVIELICSKYSSESDCIANNPEGLAKIKAAGLAEIPVEGAYLISPLLKIVNKLSDDSDIGKE